MAKPEAISILVVEDDAVIRVIIKAMLETEPAMRLVGHAADGEQAVREAIKLRPDLVLMDFRLPGLSGIEATRQIKNKTPEVHVLFLTAHDAADVVLAALAAGADGYCLKTVDQVQLSMAIRAVHAGAGWLDPAIAKHVLVHAGGIAIPKSPTEKLTSREMEVLALIVEGRSNTDIADQLELGSETVKTHIRHIMEKLQVRDRTQAAVKALREGLLPET